MLTQLNSSILAQLTEYEQQLDTFKLVMNVNGMLALLTSILAVYMIFYHSPAQMGQYKYYLLNIVIWSSLFDVYLGILYLPQITTPAIGICTNGLLRSFSDHKYLVIFFLLFVWILGSVGVSVSIAFIYRWASLTSTLYTLHKPKTLAMIVALQVGYSVPISVPILYGIYYDYNSVLIDIAESFPAIYIFNSYQHPCTFLSIKVTPIACILFLLMTVLMVCTSILINLVSIFVILKKINDNRNFMSNRTYEMHRQLTISLGVQFIIPTCVVGLPLIAIICLILMDKFDSPATRMAGVTFLEMISLHSTLNSLTMLIFTKTYRRALIRCIVRVFPWTMFMFSSLKLENTTMAMTELSQSRILRNQQLSFANLK